jgi:hypothetical protein
VKECGGVRTAILQRGYRHIIDLGWRFARLWVVWAGPGEHTVYFVDLRLEADCERL